MKTLLTFLFLATGLPHAFSREFPILQPSQFVDISGVAKNVSFTVPYPGLASNPDCVAIYLDHGTMTLKQARILANNLLVQDGDAVIYPGHNDRNLNQLVPNIFDHSNNVVLLYKLKDLGKYLTGLRLETKSRYLGLRTLFKQVFGQETNSVLLERRNSCE